MWDGFGARSECACARRSSFESCVDARAQASSARRQKSQNNFRQLNIKRKVPNRLSQSKIFLLDFDPEVIFFRVNPSQWFEFNLIFYDFLVPEKDVQVLISVSSKSDQNLSQEIIDKKGRDCLLLSISAGVSTFLRTFRSSDFFCFVKTCATVWDFEG